MFLLVGFNSVFGYEVHVAKNGNDLNRGTISDPVATIEAAQKILRSSGKMGKEPCKVIIHQGTYRITKPIQFGPEDSGSKEFPVVYCASDNKEVVITGAQLITSKWEIWKQNIYRTRVKDIDVIDQLFVNGKRQYMARYPNYGVGFVPSGNGKSVRGKKVGIPPFTGCTPNAWDVEKSKDWKDPKGAFMHGMHGGLWGSQHYIVLGKDKNGALIYEGGWQNNRSSSPHKGYRMIENVFEELDAPGEWFYDTKERWLYYQPNKGIDINNAVVEVVNNIKHLIECYGEFKQPVAKLDIPKSGNGLAHTIVKNYVTIKPVKNIKFKGVKFTGAARTFMETKEPLLRSDWCVYRGGAIHLRGTEDIVIENCRFEELGGNAVFVDSYNRRTIIRKNLFYYNGATDVNFVGSFAAVRDPAFSYSTPARPLNLVDTVIGPKSEDYPADCVVEENLMTGCGQFEKQACGINLSMSSRITIRHNTISHTPRAAINICDGTWGGHIIEWNDCFATVMETSDHGAFNSWGRDRYWHRAGPSGPSQKDKNGVPLISLWISKYPNSPRWDAYQTTIIRNNRMQCDHGWDIDLDDGSTNYKIYNNLCLSGGLKTREGYYRVVTNNIILGRGYTCNVPFPKPTYDIFEHNILWGDTYRSTKPLLWGGIRNYNFVHNPNVTKTFPAYGIQDQTKDEAGSLYGNAGFIAPEKGDFNVTDNSPAFRVGFKNFPMNEFGVSTKEFKKMAGTPPFRLPESVASNIFLREKTKKLLGAKIKTLTTDAEVTATGIFEKSGALLVSVSSDCALAQLGFRVDDVIMEIDGVKINNDTKLIKTFSTMISGNHDVKVWRNQDLFEFTFKY